MSHRMSLKVLEGFSFERILNEDPVTHALTLLGNLIHPDNQEGRVQTIIRIEKTAFRRKDGAHFFGPNGLIKKAELEENTDIYSWLFGWLGDERDHDVQINVICPATEVHIRKYTKQEQVMIHETPEMYENIVKPYIAAFPASRTKWVEDILTGESEQDKILYSCPDYIILPDMKWDLKTISSLYLVALVQDRSIKSLRDLNRNHLGVLKSIRLQAYQLVKERWGLGPGSLRMYVHYQPSYYHFHVHIVNVNYEGGVDNMAVGRAHLLDDIINLLELDSSAEPCIMRRLTISYALGDQHGLFDSIRQFSSAIET